MSGWTLLPGEQFALYALVLSVGAFVRVSDEVSVLPLRLYSTPSKRY